VANPDWHGDTGLSFSVFDGEQWSEASADVTIHVDAVADGATLTIEPARGLVGESIPLHVAAVTLDQDGSERLTIRVTGLPEGASLNAGIRQADGTWLLGSADLPSLLLTLPQGQAQRFDLGIIAETTEAHGSISTTSESLPVTVENPVSFVPPGSLTTGHPTQVFENANPENIDRRIEHTASVTDFATEVLAREAVVLPQRPVEDVQPLGDMLVTIRNQSIGAKPNLVMLYG